MKTIRTNQEISAVPIYLKKGLPLSDWIVSVTGLSLSGHIGSDGHEGIYPVVPEYGCLCSRLQV